MATTTAISEQEYRELALNDPERNWELWDGVPVEKPLMSAIHNAAAFLLGHFLQSQLDWRVFQVNVNGDRTRISPRAYFIPDVIVIPAAYQRALENDPLALGVYAEPLPFVAEVWSPSPRSCTLIASAAMKKSGSSTRTSGRWPPRANSPTGPTARPSTRAASSPSSPSPASPSTSTPSLSADKHVRCQHMTKSP